MCVNLIKLFPQSFSTGGAFSSPSSGSSYKSSSSSSSFKPSYTSRYSGATSTSGSNSRYPRYRNTTGFFTSTSLLGYSYVILLLQSVSLHTILFFTLLHFLLPSLRNALFHSELLCKFTDRTNLKEPVSQPVTDLQNVIPLITKQHVVCNHRTNCNWSLVLYLCLHEGNDF